MKAKLTVIQLELPPHRIIPTGGATSGTMGHNFDLLPTVEVKKRTMGAVSGEGIDVPQLEWNETIEWFGPESGQRGLAPVAGGHRGGGAAATLTPSAGAVAWKYVGQNKKNMYAENPTSNTFKSWHSNKFFWAAAKPPNNPPPALAALLNKPEPDKQAKHWIAQNGFTWKIPELTDRPAMGLAGGSGGGGGASLVTTNTRRRVIYFDLGFTGCPTRIKFVQILESVNGVGTIHKFINQDVPKSVVDNPTNLARWRTQVNTPNNYSL